jgi:hypothetical protein
LSVCDMIAATAGYNRVACGVLTSFTLSGLFANGHLCRCCGYFHSRSGRMLPALERGYECECYRLRRIRICLR